MADREFLRIGQVSKLLGVSKSCLRTWERLGLFAPARSAGRYRLYSQATLKELKHITYLRRVKRVNPAAMIHLRRDDPAQRQDAQPGSPDRKGIGQRLRQLRERAGLTLSDASAKSGLPMRFVTAIERGAVRCSIAPLKRLARLYGGSFFALLDAHETNRAFIRLRDRQGIDIEKGLRMELLAFGALRMQPYVLRVSPQSGSGGSCRHEGEEFFYMLQGKLEIWLDEAERYVLEPGDSLYFSSTRAHRWRSVGNDEAVVLRIDSLASGA